MTNNAYELNRIYGLCKGYGFEVTFPPIERKCDIDLENTLDNVLGSGCGWVNICESALYTMFFIEDLELYQYIEAEGTVIWIINLLEMCLEIECDTHYQNAELIIPFDDITVYPALHENYGQYLNEYVLDVVSDDDDVHHSSPDQRLSPLLS
jgi:hypothetical protein